MKTSTFTLLCVVAVAQGGRITLLNDNNLESIVKSSHLTEALLVCSSTESDDTLVAHENCDKYYICAHGTPVVVKCPVNTLYNSYKEVCDWASSVECGDRVISEPEDDSGTDEDDSNNGNDTTDNDSNSNENDNNDTCNCNPDEAPSICAGAESDNILIANENCDKYYICAHGTPVVVKCPANTLYNPFKGICDWASNVECGDRVISETEDESGTDEDDSNDGNDTTDDDSDSNENNNNDTCNCNPEEAPSICASADSDNTLIANENCDKYYICAHGTPVVVKCPANTLYNPFKGICDWASNVECGDRVISETEDESGTDEDDSNDGNDTSDDDSDSNENNNNDTCNCNPEEAPSICASADSDNTLIANENCDKYYICAHGTPVAVKCPANTLYNPFKGICDWASNVECGDRVISEPEDESGTDEVDSNHGNDTTDDDSDSNENNNNDTCNCNPQEAPSICASADSDNTLIANENCDKYYICAHGTPVAVKCPTNTLYNPLKGICDWASNVECGDRVISEPEDGSSADEDDSNDSNDTTENDSNSNENNSDDNNENDTCNCNPEEAPSICASADSDNILIANENCDKYYICAHGTPVAVKCPANTLYNPLKEICDWSSNVECGDRVISVPENETDADEDDSNNGNDATDNDSNSNENNNDGNNGNETCNCNPEEAPSICADANSDNILIANENCDKYYICAHGTPIALKCPTNTLYNPYKGICDWASNVECGDRVISKHEDASSSDEGNDLF